MVPFVRRLMLPVLGWHERRVRSRGEWSLQQAQWLGLLRENARDYSGAERLYREALDLEPGNAIGFLHLGLLYESQGRAAEAARNYSRALDLGSAFREEFRKALASKVAHLEAH